MQKIIPYLALFTACALGDKFPYRSDVPYDASAYGSYPTQNYVSSDVEGPRVNIFGQLTGDDDGIYTMLNPRGSGVEHSGPLILDNDGNMVWSSSAYGNTYNLQSQEYNGQLYLTFWAGDDSVGGHEQGYCCMVCCTHGP